MRSAAKEAPGAANRHVPCDWYYHTPLRRAEAPGNSEAPPQATPPSPGLGAFGDPHGDSSIGGRRRWIKDTDSDYVKLAKQGGQPDLLKYFVPAPPKATPEPCTDLDCYLPPSSPPPSPPPPPPPAEDPKPHVSTIPDYMIHEEFKPAQPGSYEPKRGPFDYDTKTIWQREAEEKEKKEKREKSRIRLGNLPATQ